MTTRKTKPQSKGHGWQPIVDPMASPGNGVDALVYFPSADTPIMICHWIKADDPEDEGDWYEQNVNIGPPVDVEATHWMPLPRAPA